MKPKFRALIDHGDQTAHWEYYSTFDQPPWMDGVLIVKDLQFTGLHDKNNKEVFEGDILQNVKDKMPPVEPVIYEDGQFRFGGNRFDPFGLSQWRIAHLEIVGNRWENPELLKGE